MNYLLDTHTLLFWLYEPNKLGARARSIITDRDHRIFWSIASSWEIAIKVGLGKLRLDGPVADVIPFELLANGFELLPVEHRHVLAVVDLPHRHGDPFDRLLIVQAFAEGLTVLSADTRFADYGVPLVW